MLTYFAQLVLSIDIELFRQLPKYILDDIFLYMCRGRSDAEHNSILINERKLMPIFYYADINLPDNDEFSVIIDVDNDFKKVIKNYKEKYPKSFIGANSNNSYDNAMMAAECGADFIVFTHDRKNYNELFELLNAWNALATVQSFLYSNQDINENEIENYLSSGIDFIYIDYTDIPNINKRIEKITRLHEIIKKFPHQIEHI